MVPHTKTPAHVAIIMDANGRWAAARGRERTFGHENAVESVRATFRAAVDCGVKYLTLYTFSTENWTRPQEEVNALMELFCACVTSESAELQKEGVKILIMGEKNRFSEKVLQHIARIERETSKGENLTVYLAVDYSSRAEIAGAVREMAKEVAQGTLRAEDIDPATISRHLYAPEAPDPDLVIRTGGEQRLSNFMLWQSAYAEFYFTDTMWPDFRETHFKEALAEYATRDRRFGAVSSAERKK